MSLKNEELFCYTLSNLECILLKLFKDYLIFFSSVNLSFCLDENILILYIINCQVYREFF
uniref:Uncharacterized protein n=1 Tax=Tolypiocladia glomerulata TaxID=860646 RepID=A0A1Z1MVM3_9FLOR|nr:hypothetical protein [Tolypiocladia glomerulata]ARW69845.1 hypothetical protein [Tolypiocladia glomerulata]